MESWHPSFIRSPAFFCLSFVSPNAPKLPNLHCGLMQSMQQCDVTAYSSDWKDTPTPAPPPRPLNSWVRGRWRRRAPGMGFGEELLRTDFRRRQLLPGPPSRIFRTFRIFRTSSDLLKTSANEGTIHTTSHCRYQGSVVKNFC